MAGEWEKWPCRQAVVMANSFVRNVFLPLSFAVFMVVCEHKPMNIVGTVSSVLSQKHNPAEVWRVSADETVFSAIQQMALHNVGALLVMENGKLMGIVSERDYTRKVILKGRSSRDTLVRDIVSTPVIHATPSQTVEDCMRLMTNHRIRHLPVLEGDQLLGMISQGDLVHWIITTQNHMINQMENYIQGRIMS
jgi:signal-transduction protein with cAMP-binding, CBS, and nucleotidyltransferase domain